MELTSRGQRQTTHTYMINNWYCLGQISVKPGGKWDDGIVSGRRGGSLTLAKAIRASLSEQCLERKEHYREVGQVQELCPPGCASWLLWGFSLMILHLAKIIYQSQCACHLLVLSSEPEDSSESKKQQFLGLSRYWGDRMCRADKIPSNCPGGQTPVEETAGHSG